MSYQIQADFIMLYWYSTSWQGWVRRSLRKKKLELCITNRKKTTNKAKSIFLILSEENFFISVLFDPKERIAGLVGDLVVHSQVCSHDMSITVIPSQLSQCRAGRLPGSMLGYEHSAAWHPQPAGTAKLFNPCHWRTKLPNTSSL